MPGVPVNSMYCVAPYSSFSWGAQETTREVHASGGQDRGKVPLP